MSELSEIFYGKPDDPDAIPLAEQERRYEENFPRAVADTLRDLSSGSYLAYIHDLGLKRLRAGFPIFGDEMYRWHPAIRTANADQEMADNLVYRTSDPPPDGSGPGWPD